MVERAGYCTRCRIGVVDEQGLCLLCGAPQRPLTRLGRLAELGGKILGAVLSPVSLSVVAFTVVLLVTALVAHDGRQPAAHAGTPRSGWGAVVEPQTLVAAVRADPRGAVFRFLLPAIVQALLFGLLLMVLFFLRRRGGRANITS